MTLSEENYLKAIYHLSISNNSGIATNAIAEKMDTKASSVTDMLKKLADKNLIVYKKYQGVSFTPTGKKMAKSIVRKHRLWEVFLFEKLNFPWDEVHDIAEELEHIKSDKLIQKLSEFLGNPTHDPHGDPIPDADGNLPQTTNLLLSDCDANEILICTGVKDSSTDFLKYLNKIGITIGTEIRISEIENFDLSFHLFVNQKNITISNITAKNIFVKRTLRS